MAKCLIIGDPHLKISKFKRSVDLLRWCSGLVREHRPDFVVNLGDTFDTHSVLRSQLMAEFKYHVTECLEYAKKYYYILGNHDMFKPDDAKYHALQSFNIDGLIVVDNIYEFDNITMVPYQSDFKTFPKDTRRLCFAHQTFVGADYGYFRPDVGVNADEVSAELIISGHVHKRQEFGTVRYPGTPVHDNLNDVDQVKGVELFDTETYEYQFIESPFDMYRSLSFTIAADFTVDDMHESVLESINDKDHWVIRVEGRKPEITQYINSKKWLNLQKKYSVRVKPEFTKDDAIKRVSIESKSIGDSVKEYIENVYDGSLSKDMLKLKADELINNTMKSSV